MLHVLFTTHCTNVTSIMNPFTLTNVSETTMPTKLGIYAAYTKYFTGMYAGCTCIYVLQVSDIIYVPTERYTYSINDAIAVIDVKWRCFLTA